LSPSVQAGSALAPAVVEAEPLRRSRTVTAWRWFRPEPWPEPAAAVSFSRSRDSTAAPQRERAYRIGGQGSSAGLPPCQQAYLFATQVAEQAMAMFCNYHKHSPRKKQVIVVVSCRIVICRVNSATKSRLFLAPPRQSGGEAGETSCPGPSRLQSRWRRCAVEARGSSWPGRCRSRFSWW